MWRPETADIRQWVSLDLTGSLTSCPSPTPTTTPPDPFRIDSPEECPSPPPTVSQQVDLTDVEGLGKAATVVEEVDFQRRRGLSISDLNDPQPEDDSLPSPMSTLQQLLRPFRGTPVSVFLILLPLLGLGFLTWRTQPQKQLYGTAMLVTNSSV